ncbi:MAG: DUF222 domain-containing protein [Pseudohongiella sp.]|nr:DUF222 domain-containing protein [Pseudohongiella sp.]
MKATIPASASAQKVFAGTHNPHFTPALVSTDIPADNNALIAAITCLAGHINAAQHRFLKLLAALVEREAWGDGGAIKSPAHWLNYYCGIDLGAAREKVRVAKCLAQLPQIDEAFASGAISYSKVRAMTRSATPQNEAFLLNIARHGTAHHVEMLVRKHQRVQRLVQADEGLKENNNVDAAAAQFAGRELHWHYDDDGMLVIRGRLTPEDGALLIKAIDGAFAQLFQPSANSNTQVAGDQKKDHKSVSAETFYSSQNPELQKNVSAETFSGLNGESGAQELPGSPEIADAQETSDIQQTTADTFPQKRADALMLLAELSLGRNGSDMAPFSSGAPRSPLTPPQRHQMIIHIEKDSLMHSAAHHCSIEHGPFLSPASARRLACDTALLTVLEDSHGNVLNVGRKTRTVSPALRRALTIRDHCCRFPGCTESRFVDAHHIHHWCDGGETKLENLVLLCRRHHRLVHEQAYEIINHGMSRHRAHIEFRRPDREILPEALYPQFAGNQTQEESLEIERQHQRMGLDIDELTAVTRWQGERMDYSMAIEGMGSGL